MATKEQQDYISGKRYEAEKNLRGRPRVTDAEESNIQSSENLNMDNRLHQNKTILKRAAEEGSTSKGLQSISDLIANCKSPQAIILLKYTAKCKAAPQSAPKGGSKRGSIYRLLQRRGSAFSTICKYQRSVGGMPPAPALRERRQQTPPRRRYAFPGPSPSLLALW